MSVSFDWEFEESDPSDPPEGGTPFSGRRRAWLSLGMTLLGLLVVGGLVVRTWLNNRFDAIEKIEEGLRNVVELELKDIANGDVELFRAVQDPTVPRWRSQQMARYLPDPNGAPDAYGFAPAPGLAPAGRAPEIVQVRVVGPVGRVKLRYWFQPTYPPNLTASLLERWLYAASSVTPVPLPFHVTWFYRLGEDGAWYHTPPPGDHAGIPYSWYGDWLDVHASEIEDALLDPAARDWSALMRKSCQLLNCSPGLHYSLHFGDASAPQVYGARWRLPALYLAGMPDNAAARVAWQQGLKLWLVEALARSRAGSGMDQRVVYRQLVTLLQAELGLIETPPLDVETLTQALRAGEQHFVQDLWWARYNPDDPQGNQLLDAEVSTLLRWLQARIGAKRVFALLPALRSSKGLGMALLAVYPTASLDLESEWREWLVHLSELTGVLPAPQGAEVFPSLPPGDQIALVCDGRVWVGNADGSAQAPLTAPGWPFGELRWSPDGRWLLTTWQHGLPGQARALYLLAADGSGGRLLTNEPSLVVSPHGWSLDGRQAFYHVQRGAVGTLESVDVESGETRQLPGWPAWSPDGRRLVYRAQDDTLWLAGANWENARQVLDPIETRGELWSPDSSGLALALLDDDPAPSAVVLYDLATGSLTPLITTAELTEILLSSGAGGALMSDGADPAELARRPLQGLFPLGWSADGQHLAVRAKASLGASYLAAPAVLAVASLDGSPPRVLAYGNQGLYPGNAAWSPTQADQLAFVWRTAPGPSGLVSHLYDLEAGPVYTATGKWNAAWSPDGAWLAFAGQGPVTIVDQEGRAGFTLAHDEACSSVAWNPAADLGELSRFVPLSVTLTTSHDGWGFANARADYDRRDQVLRVWGELVNHSGGDQRVTALSALLVYARDEASVNFDQPHRHELAPSITLAGGQSLPFNLNLPWSNGVQLEDALTVLARVSAEPGQPNREDLDISPEGLALSGPVDALYVSGVWENPGPDLEEHATVVVTVYDAQGRVLGWGWQRETAPALLTGGAHDFAVAVTLSETVSRMEQLYYYRVQLFAR